MLVDDDENILEVVGDLLIEAGHSVQRSNNGVDAMQLLEQGSFQVAILDLGLPGVTGEELFRAIQKKEMATEVIFVTGNTEIGLATQLLRDGAYDYLLKPFSAALLERSIKAALRHQELEGKKTQLIKQLMKKTKVLQAKTGEQAKVVAELTKRSQAAVGYKAAYEKLAEEAKRLQELVKEKDETLSSLQEARNDGLVQNQQALDRLQGATGFVYASRFLSIVNLFCVVLGLFFFTSGVIGERYLVKGAHFSEMRTALMGQSFLCAIIFLEGVLLIRLYSILKYFRLAIGDDEEKPRTLFERVLTNTVTVTVAMTFVFAGVGIFLFMSGVRSADSSLILVAYLSATAYRDGTALALVGSAISLLLSSIATTFLITMNYVESFKDQVGRDMAKKRLTEL